MIWRVEITEKQGLSDPLGQSVRKDILDLGVGPVSGVRVVHVYLIEGNISEDQIRTISEQLLADRVTQDYRYTRDLSPSAASGGESVIEIAYHPGVMDPVEESTLKGIRDLGFEGAAVRTARQYHITGHLPPKSMNTIVERVLSNKLIQHVVASGHAPQTLKIASKRAGKVEALTVDLLQANDKELLKISRDGQLFLNLEEMKQIQKHFRSLKRSPTDCELETIAQTWSEHCHHKTFRGNIEYTFQDGKDKKTKTIRSLLKSTIVKATKKLDKDWCVSVFHDNAGIIKFDKDDNICFKVETHNHPSALEPFGGANTGIGGVIRDILGTGLGAKPMCNTDVFCFAPPDYDPKDLPPGTLHPKRVMKGVVSGVRDYGNKMGIPTVNGAILFDEGFVGNPLVYCGTVGIIPKGKEHKKVRPGDVIVVAGGRTGRDGIHGATFSSGELTDESETVSSGAVQIGDPIQEKKVLDVLLKARDKQLYSAITDCGAGGLSSAVGEMGEVTGARVDLEKVPLKYEGLSYTETWISESQERMVMAVPPARVRDLLDLFASENVEATVIGEFSGDGQLKLFCNGTPVCDLDMKFLHGGIPKITKKAVWKKTKAAAPKVPVASDLNEALLECLSHYNVCSKEWVIRQYDHEVQGGTVIKPLVGVSADGPSDASVIRPKPDSFKGIAVANGINIRYGMIDPYWMAASCIDEAIRQIVCVGGDPGRVALLDNFCWGNPDKPDRLGGLVRCAQGCYQAAVAFQTPFISGKDSLYNEYTQAGKSLAIPGTILISSIGIVPDIRKCVTMDFKKAGSLIYAAGMTKEELGGSIYFDTLGHLGSSVPEVDFRRAARIFGAVFDAVQKGLVLSAHDCSEGGLGAALAEMAFSGGLGVTALLKKLPYQGNDRDDYRLFSESNSRIILEVDPRHQTKFEALFQGLPFSRIGRVEESPEFVIYGSQDKPCVNLYIDDLKRAWREPLNW